MSTPPASYLIVGAGVFGASTALHLARRHPDARITLVDRDAYAAPTRVAASWDWNKVVRADYRDPVYTRLALEARDVWTSDPLWQHFYHESGIYWISGSGFAQRVLQNFRELGVEDARLSSHPVNEARTMHGGVFADADYEGVSEVLVNGLSGWADARDALRKVIETAVGELGVRYVEAEVAAFVFEKQSQDGTAGRAGGGGGGGCIGARTADGTVLAADRVVLCTGAFTPKLLVDSAPQRPELHAGPRIIAAGVTEAIAPLSPEQVPAFSGMPVAIQENPPERGEAFYPESSPRYSRCQ